MSEKITFFDVTVDDDDKIDKERMMDVVIDDRSTLLHIHDGKTFELSPRGAKKLIEILQPLADLVPATEEEWLRG